MHGWITGSCGHKQRDEHTVAMALRSVSSSATLPYKNGEHSEYGVIGEENTVNMEL